VLKPFVAEVVVSNPLRTKAIPEAKLKTDKVDALVLAQLLCCDFLPRVWEPPVETQQPRRQMARRAALVAGATAIKNRSHAVFHQRLIKSPGRDLFCKQGRQWLTEVELDEEGRTAI
jgi:transposase